MTLEDRILALEGIVNQSQQMILRLSLALEKANDRNEELHRKLDFLIEDKKSNAKIEESVEKLVALQNDSHYKLMGVLDERITSIEEKNAEFQEKLLITLKTAGEKIEAATALDKARRSKILEKQGDTQEPVEESSQNNTASGSNTGKSTENEKLDDEPKETEHISEQAEVDYIEKLSRLVEITVNRLESRKAENTMWLLLRWVTNNLKLVNNKVNTKEGRRFTLVEFEEALINTPWFVFPKEYQIQCTFCHRQLSLISNIRADGVSVGCPCYPHDKTKDVHTIIGPPKEGFNWIRCLQCEHFCQVPIGELPEKCGFCKEAFIEHSGPHDYECWRTPTTI